ncbi:putative ankyrin repeat protein RF_1087 [Hydractinia symbiolongicarpus]|uniref:putative ankyrin repeat protein RF_1087 n=1 Tax=Hydractinia symbiolongicarpus TaxID=13093 RepID=UPI00254E3CAF|nr:putative ankyrin repeat protein RF_1087 [Hydractinia symbiolongicarpus]
MSQKRKTNLITQTQQANIAHNIEVAIKDNDLKKLKLIFEDYPNLLSYESHNEKSWLHLAAREGTVKIVTYLVKKGIDVNVLDKNKHSPLHYACMNDKYENILILCKLGSKVNHKQSEGNTPLHHAAYFNNVNTIQALLQEGADINARNTHGETALHLGCSSE